MSQKSDTNPFVKHTFSVDSAPVDLGEMKDKEVQENESLHLVKHSLVSDEIPITKERKAKAKKKVSAESKKPVKKKKTKIVGPVQPSPLQENIKSEPASDEKEKTLIDSSEVGEEIQVPIDSIKPIKKKKSALRQAQGQKPKIEDTPLTTQIAAEKYDEWAIHHIHNRKSGFSDEMSHKILDYLIKLDLLTREKADEIHTIAEREGKGVVDIIVDKNYMKENDVGTAVAAFFKCTYAHFKGVIIPTHIITLIPKNVSEKMETIVFDMSGDVIKVATTNPTDSHFIHLIEKKTGKIAEMHYTTSRQINEALKSYPAEFEDKMEILIARASENISHLSSLNSISQVFDSLVLMAYQRGASDVHIEPFEKEIRIRFRIDGVLNTISTLPEKYLETIINHIKVLAKLRIDMHNAAQDGRFHIAYGKTTINFRVSIMPTHYGEKAVLRLLTSETQEWTLRELGYKDNDRDRIEKSISKTNGMILVCGPTGSGKTTTLYAILKELNHEGVNISTIEDPIEYGLPGIMQTQINPHTNITYAEGLKSLMRQDPDILMIGEIRDFETGKIAVNAALTGHIVLSTLHTNNASLAPLRMLQMGVDPYLITTTVNLIIAQRLIRKICNSCLTSYTLSSKELDEMAGRFALDDEQKELFKKHFGTGSAARLYKGRGCEICGNSGYHARSVIAETLQIKDNIRGLIMKNASESDIQKAAETNGMITMMEDGFIKVKEGITTLEEVFRVINQ